MSGLAARLKRWALAERLNAAVKGRVQDRQAAKPFLDEVKWPEAVYFEDGLSRAMAVDTIPTTVVFDRQGHLFSRMNGYNPERFVDALVSRIRDALGN